MIRTGWDRVAVSAFLTAAALLTYRAEAREATSSRRIGEAVAAPAQETPAPVR